jgi:hypothetical protein
VIALRDGDDVDSGAGTGSFAVAEGGATALPSLSTCGPSTTKSLDVRGDGDSIVSLQNGDSGALVVAGIDVIATNIWSADYDWESCEDVPVGFVTTWILTRAP